MECRKSSLAMLVCTLVCLLVFVACAAMVDVTGNWALTVDLGGQGGDATFELEEEDGKITGTYSGALGAADVTGTASGDEVEFSFDTDAGKVSYKGTISDDAMEGTCDYGSQLGSGTFAGTRSE